MTMIWMAGAVAILLLASNGPALAAEAPRTPLNERIRDIRALQSAQLSPDGREAALVITASSAEGGQTHIWLSRTDGSGVRQLTYSGGAGEPGERAPSWSPDGAFIYFMAKRGGGQKLLRLPTAGGEAVALVIARNENGTLQAGWGASSEDGVEASPGSYSVSPDGRWIAVIRRMAIFPPGLRT
jgi:dipeptidyl aminopeptidase/acylaminoacyl peptidase